MKEPRMPYIHGEPEGLGRRENEEVREEEERLQGGGIPSFEEFTDSVMSDIGQERDEEFEGKNTERLRDIGASFTLLPVAVQQEILQDMQTKMKKNRYKTIHDMLDDLEYIVGQNEKKFGTGPGGVHVLTQEESKQRRMKK